jgi:hypothetical protein
MPELDMLRREKEMDGVEGLIAEALKSTENILTSQSVA